MIKTVPSMTKRGLCLDPRTKMLLVITISTLLISGNDSGVMIFIKPILAGIPFILLLSAGKIKKAGAFLLLTASAYCAQIWLLPITAGILNICIIVTCGIFFRFLPGIMMGAYLVSTTRVNEFMAAMYRMRMPEQIAIPISVLFRFFPTVLEEHRAIEDAMKMRGIRFGGGKPGKMLEYRLVPLMISCVKIGDELSAAALVRGLGAPIKRTSIGTIGFQVQDMLLLLLCLIAIITFSLNKLQIL